MFEQVGRVVKMDDDREFLLVGRIDDDIETYVYLMSLQSPLEVLIAMEIELGNKVIELEIVKDEEEKRRIYNLFLQKARLGLL